MKPEIKAKLFIGNTLLYLSTGLLVLFASGCIIHDAHFRPEGSDPYVRSEEASSYQQLNLDGTTIGNARIWSRGISKHIEASGLVMHVGMRIMNDTQDEMLLDLENTELQAYLENQPTLTIKDIVEMLGSDRIPPGTRTRIELWYLLPEGFDSHKVRSFEFNWAIKRHNRRLSLSTPFYRDPKRGRTYVASSHRWGYHSWYPFWSSYPFWFHPGWSYWYGYYYRPSYLWWWNYPVYWRYPNHRYYKRNHHLIPRRSIRKSPRHRYRPRRHKTR